MWSKIFETLGVRSHPAPAAHGRPAGRRPRLSISLLMVITTLGAIQLAPATATHACPDGTLPVHYTPPADAALRIWDVEGKITAFSRDSRTITANGMTLIIPASLLVKTNDLDQTVGNVEFAEDNDPSMVDLVDAALEANRSVIGGTVIAGGETVYSETSEGTCISFVANSVFVELAENGLIGPLMSVNVADGSFVVNGATIKMNADPRFPADLLDLGSSPITVADLEDNEGALMDVGGYFDATAGVLYGTAVQAEVLMRQPDKDTVAIERARVQQTRLRVGGIISKHPVTGLFAERVTVYPSAMNAEGTACEATTAFGTATVDPLAGDFDFRMNNVSPAPSTVCVASPNGGVDDADVTLR